MPTLLDQRPVRRKPTLFGRALVQQQIANERAAENDREQTRLEQSALDTKRHQDIQDKIAAAHLEIDTLKQEILMKNDLQKVQKEKDQLEAFKSAQTMIGQLKPTDPLLSAQVAEIQAKHPILFEGAGTQFGQALGKQVSELFAQRKAITEAHQKLTDEATKISAAHGGTPIVMRDGVPDVTATAKAAAVAQQSQIDRSGLVPKSAKGPDGIDYAAAPDKTKDLHAQQKMFLDDYHSVEKERLNPKVYANKDAQLLIDARRVQAVKNLQSVGIDINGDARMPADTTTAAPTETVSAAPAATDPRMDLAKAAIEDPAASVEHKSAARKILGYQDEQPTL